MRSPWAHDEDANDPGEYFPYDHSNPPSVTRCNAMLPLAVGPVPEQEAHSDKIVILSEELSMGYHAQCTRSTRLFIEHYRR